MRVDMLFKELLLLRVFLGFWKGSGEWNFDIIIVINGVWDKILRCRFSVDCEKRRE